MATINLLYKDAYPINDRLSVMIPTVGEVLEQEDMYYSVVSILTASPIDYMVELDDVGIDFAALSDFDFFMTMFPVIQQQDTSLVLGKVDLKKFETWINKENEQLFLYDKEDDIVIDRAVYTKIGLILRKIHHLKQDKRKPGNEEARKYMLQRAREKKKRKKRATDSQLESLITALVNTPEFKYGYREVLDLSIYQFNESVIQIQHKIDFDHKMEGIYAGTVDASKINQKELNWLNHK